MHEKHASCAKILLYVAVSFNSLTLTGELMKLLNERRVVEKLVNELRINKHE